MIPAIGIAVAAVAVAAWSGRGRQIEPLPWDEDLIVTAICTAARELGNGADSSRLARLVAAAVWPDGHDARSGHQLRLSWPPRQGGEQMKTWTRLLAVVENLDLRECAT